MQGSEQASLVQDIRSGNVYLQREGGDYQSVLVHSPDYPNVLGQFRSLRSLEAEGALRPYHGVITLENLRGNSNRSLHHLYHESGRGGVWIGHPNQTRSVLVRTGGQHHFIGELKQLPCHDWFPWPVILDSETLNEPRGFANRRYLP
jgi:hypothetical protein